MHPLCVRTVLEFWAFCDFGWMWSSSTSYDSSVVHGTYFYEAGDIYIHKVSNEAAGVMLGILFFSNLGRTFAALAERRIAGGTALRFLMRKVGAY